MDLHIDRRLGEIVNMLLSCNRRRHDIQRMRRKRWERRRYASASRCQRSSATGRRERKQGVVL